MQPDRWGLLLILTLLNILNFADRYLIIAFSTRIVPELGMSNLQFGLLTGIVFTLVYTIFGLFLGSLADRVHRPRLIGAGLALWSGLTALTGMTMSFLQMALARLFVGVGEAALSPAALSMLADGFKPSRRALANGIYYLGIPIGIGGSFILASLLGPWLGWRGSFIALGLLGIAAAVLVVLFMRDPSRTGAHPDRPKGSFRETFRALSGQVRSNRPMQWILLGCIAATCVQGAAVLDLLWWVSERGFEERNAQQLNGSMFLAGGVFGSIAGGLMADRMHARMAGGRLIFLAIAFSVGIPLMLLFRLIPADSALFLPLAFTGNAVFMIVFGPALASLHEIVPVSQRAATAALFILVTSLIGSAGGSALAGGLADLYAANGSAEPLTWAIISVQSLGLLTIPAFYFAARALPRRPLATAVGGAVRSQA